MRPRARWLAALAALATAAALVAGGCAPPELNGTGAIRCGNDGGAGGCPAEFACRFGRCCPVDAPLATCPVAEYVTVVDDGSAYACDEQSRCPSAGDYQCRFGRCCPADHGTGVCSPRRVGNPCGSSADCDSPLATLTATCPSEVPTLATLPGGYCSAAICNINEPDTGCGDNAFCFYGQCVARCTFPQGQPYALCRSDGANGAKYSCYPRQPDDPTSTLGFCLPDCTRDPTICRGARRCNPGTRFCEGACTSTADCGGGQYACVAGSCEERFVACADAADCPSTTGLARLECVARRCVTMQSSCNAAVPCLAVQGRALECFGGRCAVRAR